MIDGVRNIPGLLSRYSGSRIRLPPRLRFCPLPGNPLQRHGICRRQTCPDEIALFFQALCLKLKQIFAKSLRGLRKHQRPRFKMLHRRRSVSLCVEVFPVPSQAQKLMKIKAVCFVRIRKHPQTFCSPRISLRQIGERNHPVILQKQLPVLIIVNRSVPRQEQRYPQTSLLQRSSSFRYGFRRPLLLSFPVPPQRCPWWFRPCL